MSVCLLIHGFTGSPHEVQPLADYLRSLGYEVHTPVLAGHGATRAEMRQATRQDWIESVESEVKRLSQQNGTLHIVGFSMGGLIAAHLAAKYPVHSLTVLSAPVFYVNKKQMLRTVADTVRKLTRNRNQHANDDSGESSFGEAALRYSMKIRITPIKSVLHFRRLVAELKPSLAKVTAPALIIQGVQDDLVEPRSAEYIYKTIGSVTKQIHFFQESGHMICLGCDQTEVNRLVVEFIKQIDSEVEA